MNKVRKNQHGIVLYTVVLVMLLALVLVSAIIGFVHTNISKTQDNFKQQQAYMTASTCLEAFINDIQERTNIATTDAALLQQKKDLIKQLQDLADANGGAGTTTSSLTINGTNFSDYGMGDCVISIAREGSTNDNIKVTATCTYLDQEETVVAHISTGNATVPADYSNAIEITGSGNASYDNLNVIGDMSTINDSSTALYTFTNNTTVYGKYFIYGSVQNNVGFQVILQPSLTDSTVGSSVNVSGDFNEASNGSRFYATLDGGTNKTNAYNYVNVGNTFNKTSTSTTYVGLAGDSVTSTDYQVDFYCGNAILSGGFKQNGNFYCYKSDDTTSPIKGDVTINSAAKININGDLYVDGTLTLKGGADTELNVTGSIYCTNVVIENSAKINGKSNLADVTNIVNMAPPKSGSRATKPEIPQKSDFYKYYPEYMFVGADTSVTKIADNYKNFYALQPGYTAVTSDTIYSVYETQKNNGTLNNIIASGQRTDGTSVDAKFAFEITDDCTIGKYDIQCGSTGQKKILVTVPADDDVVIRLADGISLGAENATMFVVRNLSTEANPHFCYFVSDSGVGTVNKDDRTDKSGFTPVNISVQKWSIMDFDTYINMFTTTELAKTSFDGITGCEFDSSFVLNPTDVDISGTTKINNGKINVLLSAGSKFSCTNNSFFECEWYCPEATVEVATSGSPGIKCTDSAGNITSHQICNIGMVVAESFGNANTAFYVFNKPDPKSMWAAIKDLESTDVQGYTLQRYDFY